jgi:hypothetical protein
VDTVFFQIDIDFPIARELTEEDLMWTDSSTAPGPAGPKCLLSWMKLCGGAVENTFDHDNGDVIAKADFFRKTRRATEDVVHEPFRG